MFLGSSGNNAPQWLSWISLLERFGLRWSYCSLQGYGACVPPLTMTTGLSRSLDNTADFFSKRRRILSSSAGREQELHSHISPICHYSCIKQKYPDISVFRILLSLVTFNISKSFTWTGHSVVVVDQDNFIPLDGLDCTKEKSWAVASNKLPLVRIPLESIFETLLPILECSPFTCRSTCVCTECRAPLLAAWETDISARYSSFLLMLLIPEKAVVEE